MPRFGEVYRWKRHKIAMCIGQSVGEGFLGTTLAVPLGERHSPVGYVTQGDMSFGPLTSPIDKPHWEKVECETVESILGRPLPGSTE